MSKKQVWGLLYPLRNTLPFIEFKKEEYTVGKDANCSCVINEKHLNNVDLNLVSKKHFKISHKKDAVYLDALAVTYVNKNKFDQGQKTTLKHNDCIAIAKSHLKVFVYLDKEQCDNASRSLPQSISEKYLQSYSLGEGGFGEVSLLFEKNTSKMFALKTVKMKPQLKKYAYTEKNILEKINHPCVINTQEVVDTDSCLFIVMEFMEGGDLQRRVQPVKSLQERHIKLIFFQLAQAIQYLHQQNIVHRDIKPENVLLAANVPDSLIKVADFGVSKILNPGTQMDTHVGTPHYQAPEILNKSPTYTKQVDIWSMGILLYFCLSSQFPFGSNNVAGEVKFPPRYWKLITSTVTDLIKGMLKHHPKERIDLDKVLSHPWLKDDTMRRKAHQLMWPGKLYVPQNQAPTPLYLQRGGSLRQPARGVLQYITANSSHDRTGHSPNRLQPGMGLRGLQQNKPAAKVPAPNAAKLSAPTPVRPQDVVRDLYKPSVKPAVQYATPFKQANAAGVRYEPVKPVKDAVKGFERK